jgi:hypothetical protein
LPIPVIVCPLGGQDINRDLPEGTVILNKPVSVKTMSDALQSAPDVVEHVLIVSEYVEFLRLLTRMLTARYGHTTAISQAMDHAAAIGRFEVLKPEIVLVDLDVNQEEIGVETIAELHQRNHQKTLFVAVTWGLEDGARGDASLTLHSASGLTLDDRLRYLAAMLDVTYPASETLDV